MKQLSQERQSIIGRKFVGKNFVTPEIIEYGASGDFIYELSYGKSSMLGTLYGVTVLTNTGQEVPLSKVCNSLQEARDYIKSLENYN